MLPLTLTTHTRTGVSSLMLPLNQSEQYGEACPRVLMVRSISPSRLMSSRTSMPHPSAETSQAAMESPGASGPPWAIGSGAGS